MCIPYVFIAYLLLLVSIITALIYYVLSYNKRRNMFTQVNLKYSVFEIAQINALYVCRCRLCHRFMKHLMEKKRQYII